jgi:hypothetical protein
LFFFEKKNQKTSSRYSARGCCVRTLQTDKSIFASFSSEKDDIFLSSDE